MQNLHEGCAASVATTTIAVAASAATTAAVAALHSLSRVILSGGPATNSLAV